MSCFVLCFVYAPLLFLLIFLYVPFYPAYDILVCLVSVRLIVVSPAFLLLPPFVMVRLAFRHCPVAFLKELTYTVSRGSWDTPHLEHLELRKQAFLFL